MKKGSWPTVLFYKKKDTQSVLTVTPNNLRPE